LSDLLTSVLLLLLAWLILGWLLALGLVGLIGTGGRVWTSLLLVSGSQRAEEIGRLWLAA